MTAIKLPVRIEDDKYLVGANAELITALPDATKEERDAIVQLMNANREARNAKPYATCGNCGRHYTEAECDTMYASGEISDLRERVAPGEVMPVCECADCHALVHINHGIVPNAVRIHDALLELIEALDGHVLPNAVIEANCKAQKLATEVISHRG